MFGISSTPCKFTALGMPPNIYLYPTFYLFPLSTNYNGVFSRVKKAMLVPQEFLVSSAVMVMMVLTVTLAIWCAHHYILILTKK